MADYGPKTDSSSPNMAPEKKRSGDRSRTSWAAPDRGRWVEIVAALLVATLYGLVVWRSAPRFAAQPNVALVHVLFVLGLGVVLFGCWDLFALRALRRIVERDRSTLAQYLEDRGPVFKGAATDLAGGLVQTAVRRTRAAGRSSTRLFGAALGTVMRSVRVGSGYLRYAFASAPLLGLFGTILGLRSTFGNPALIEAGSLQLDRAMPYLGLALVTTMLGLGVTLLSLFFIGLSNPAIARDCQRLLEPLIQLLSSLDRGAGAASTGSSQALMAPGSYSKELERSRAVSGGLAFSIAAALVFVVALPGGVGDRLFAVPIEDETSSATPQPVPTKQLQREDPPPPEPPPPPPPKVTDDPERIDLELGELLDRYEQAVVPDDAESLVFAFLRYRQPTDKNAARDDETGHALLARTFSDDRTAIAGIVNIVSPADAHRRLDLTYPRLIARVDCLVRDRHLAGVPMVTFGLLDGSKIPLVQTARFDEFQAYRDASGFPYRWGQVLDRIRIQRSLSAPALRTFMDRVTSSWRRLGRPRSQGEEHIVLWLLYEAGAKIERAKASFKDLSLQGSQGDFITLRWDASDAGEVVLRHVELLSPPAVQRQLEAPAPARTTALRTAPTPTRETSSNPLS